MKSLLLFTALCITLSFTQCKDDDTSFCVTENPTEDLIWLKTRIRLYEQLQSDQLIFQGTYNLKTVFMIYYCCPMCEVVPAYYDCMGNELTDVQYDQIGNLELIWSLPNSSCGG